MRHVGQELRLVLRRKRKLLRLVLQRAPRLLDLLVLAFHLGVLFGELLRLLPQLLVRLLQLLLLRLQFGRQLLRLLQQPFGLHRRFNRVQHDTDRGRQLLKECKMRRRKLIQRRQLDHRLHAVFKQHRQHDHVTRHSFEQSRPHRQRIRWQVRR